MCADIVFYLNYFESFAAGVVLVVAYACDLMDLAGLL